MTVTETRDRPGQEALKVEEVSVTLGGRRVLDQVSFGLGAGQLAGLIGANGAGKTTLLRVVLGLLRPDAGRVEVAGRPLAHRHRSIGYVPQKVAFDPDLPMRARDLVELGVDGDRFGFRRRAPARTELVDEMLAAVGADGFSGSRVGRLSGGEQQRVLIAHALISRPKLLLLDEPLANLDLRSGQEIVALLRRIATDQEVAVLLSAHEVNPLLPVMDRVVYLAHGRAASGDTGEVVRADVLSALYRHPVEVLRVGGRLLVVAGTGDDVHCDVPEEVG